MQNLRRLLLGSVPVLALVLLATSSQQPAASSQQPAASSQQPAASSQQPAASSCSVALGDEEPSPLELHWQGLVGAVELIDAGNAPVIVATNHGDEALTFDLQVDVEGTVNETWNSLTVKAGHTISLAVPLAAPAPVPGLLSRQAVARAQLLEGGQPTVRVFAPAVFFHEDEELGGKSFILYSERVMREEFAGGTSKDPSTQKEAGTIAWDEGRPVKFGGVLPSVPADQLDSLEHDPGEPTASEK